MKLTLEVDKLSTLDWCIDASHQIQKDYKGHTGGALILGKGAMNSICRG